MDQPPRYLTTHPIAWRAAALQRFTRPAHAGAAVTFMGIVRPDPHDGRQVAALWYDAYAAMAEATLERLVEAVRHRHGADVVVLRHRLGRVPVGAISLLAVVAATHRAEAYQASQQLLEGIKQDVPIWKRAQYTDGTSAWMDTCAPVGIQESSHALV